MVQYGRSSRSSGAKSVWSSWWEWRFEKVLVQYGCEKVPNWNVSSLSEKKDCSWLCMWSILNWLERNRTSITLGQYSWKTLNEGEPTSFLDHVYLGCTEKRMSDLQGYCWWLQKYVRIKDFCRGYRKKCHKQKPRWNLMPKQYLNGHMEGHGRKCVERCCELTNKTTAIIQSRNAMHGWPPVYTNCSEMPKLGTYWFTWCPMVREQTCSCSYKMDKSMWQTFGAFDLLHSSHMWVQATLLCGKHSTTVQTRIFSRLILQETVKTQNRHQVEYCAFRKTNIRANMLDVARTRLDAGLLMDGILAPDLWDSFLTKPKTLESRRETCRQISI